MKSIILLSLLSLLLFSTCKKSPEKLVDSPSNITNESKIISDESAKLIKSIEPFFKPMGKPNPDEWLASFSENGQLFVEYINSNPNLPTAERKIIYIQPIGKFSNEKRKIVNLTAEFLEIFYGLKVKLLSEIKFDEPLSLENYRIHPSWKTKQIRTGYIMEKFLKPNLPKDAVVLIALTNEDLYPDKTFSFVFGQASLQERVGVYSLYQLEDKQDFRRFLTRTIKIATHEIGHIFSMAHCTKYECLMSGTNHLGETDKHPMDACPECTAKTSIIGSQNFKERYKKLALFCKRNGLEEDFVSFKNKENAVYSGKSL